MKLESDLVITLICCAFVFGFCCGTCTTKFLMRDIVKKYEIIFGKCKNPLINIL